jgi:hypothetical protein
MLHRPVWSDAARADIRALDRATAMRLFDALSRYLASGEGDVKQLQGAPPRRVASARRICRA